LEQRVFGLLFVGKLYQLPDLGSDTEASDAPISSVVDFHEYASIDHVAGHPVVVIAACD
jgi:hypothetical protein